VVARVVGAVPFGWEGFAAPAYREARAAECSLLLGRDDSVLLHRDGQTHRDSLDGTGETYRDDVSAETPR
jgi:hypothetical protein